MVLVHPLFVAAMKTLVSSKNLVLLSCSPVALFLDIPLKLIEIYLSGLFFNTFQYDWSVLLLQEYRVACGFAYDRIVA